MIRIQLLFNKRKIFMYILIINPVAGNGRAKYFYNQFIRDVRIKNVRFKSFFTKYKGHAEEIIRIYLDKNNTFQIKGIIVVGGDGTLHDVINGFDHDLIPVALIPGGSGNDFARGIRIPKNRNHIIDNIVKKISKPYSYGHYKLPQKSVRSFLNCVGFGFDAVVANHVNHSKLKRILNKLKLGKLSYLYALLVQLFRYKPIDITIELDGVTKEFPACFFATVSNQPYFGGG